MARNTPEGKVKKEVKEYLTDLGAFHRWPVANGYGGDQVDCYGCFKGRYFTIETKRADGKGVLSDRQRAHLDKVRAAGGVAIVALSWADVQDAFEEAGLLQDVV